MHAARAAAVAALLGATGCGGSSSSEAGARGEPAPKAKASSPVQAPPTGPPSLDPSTLPGSILFVSERDGNLEVYRWRAGAPLQRLTDDPRADFVAEVAPDGSGWTRVATEEGAVPEAHREQLSWVPLDAGAKPVPFGAAGRRARSPSWAPDRSFVVFESDASDVVPGASAPVEEVFSDLWRWEPSGTLTRLTHTEHGAFEPAVAPDGRSIAFVSTRDGNPEIYVMDARGQEPRRLTDWRRDDTTPRWSPDGTRLAFLRVEQGGTRLFVLDPTTGGEPTRLVPTAEGEQVIHAEHAWSPDGTRLAYVVHRPRQPPHVAVTVLADGSTRVISPPGIGATMPSWSPDGRALVTVGTAGDPEALDLYAVRLADRAWVRLTSTPAADWLPRWTAR